MGFRRRWALSVKLKMKAFLLMEREEEWNCFKDKAVLRSLQLSIKGLIDYQLKELRTGQLQA